MHLTLARWGNSLALRLPSSIIKETRLEEGATVRVEVGADGSLVVTPARRRFKLADLVAGMPEARIGDETDWGRAEGNEAW
jgi:antitoxin MazE